MKLDTLLKKKNPYLFKAKNHHVASDLIKDILAAHVYSSEEKLFGDFLEELAIFVSSATCSGRKSTATGIDLEFDRDGVRFVVSIKSGTNWGNASQQTRQKQDFEKAVAVLRQSKQNLKVQPVLGICYGKVKSSFIWGNVHKVVGQNFWYLISGNELLYTDIIEPVGFNAHQHNEQFEQKKSAVINNFTMEFSNRFCVEGAIDWIRLVQFNSGNLDLKPSD
jgi:hypothetical protein